MPVGALSAMERANLGVIQRYVADAAVVRLTATHLSKHIVDAVAPLRAHMALRSFHDYAATTARAGREAVLLGGASVTPTGVFLYTTSRGDRRINVSGLRAVASAGDALAVFVLADTLAVVNLTASSLAADDAAGRRNVAHEWIRANLGLVPSATGAPIGAVAPVAPSFPGAPYSEIRIVKTAAAEVRYVRDPDKGGRGLAAHEATRRLLADELRRRGRAFTQGVPTGANYDLAWEVSPALYICEVKSLEPANEVSQLRLGIGQVLDYADRLAPHGHVVPVLAVEREPADPRWSGVCSNAGILLTWPAAFAALP